MSGASDTPGTRPETDRPPGGVPELPNPAINPHKCFFHVCFHLRVNWRLFTATPLLKPDGQTFNPATYRLQLTLS